LLLPCLCLPLQWSTPEVLALLQEGQHPLELLGISHLLPRLQQQLAAMLGALHRTFSPYTTYGAEGVPKDKAPQVGSSELLCLLL
jgi:hypothetical protein